MYLEMAIQSKASWGSSEAWTMAGFFTLVAAMWFCNYVFVDDVAEASVTLAEHPGAVRQTYNLSDDAH